MARRVPLSSTKVQEGTGVCYSQSGSVPAVGDLGDLNSIAEFGSAIHVEARYSVSGYPAD